MSDRLRQALEDTTEIEEGLLQAQKELAKTRARMEYVQVLIAMGQRVSIPRWQEPTFETAPAPSTTPSVTAASVVVPRPATPAPARPAPVEAPVEDRKERGNTQALKAAEEKIRQAKERTRRAEEMVASAQAEAEAAEKERRATEERAQKAEEEARRLEAEVAR